jgi:hypothetical protein
LPTKAHFSSNWTSRVLGGKSHELVVELLGVVAGQAAVADDGVFTHPDQAGGLADADPLGDVLQDGHDLVLGQAGVEQGGAFALGEAGLAGLTVKQAALLRTVLHADGQVSSAALAVGRALFILTAEAAQLVHGLPSVARNGRLGLSRTTEQFTKRPSDAQY